MDRHLWCASLICSQVSCVSLVFLSLVLKHITYSQGCRKLVAVGIADSFESANCLAVSISHPSELRVTRTCSPKEGSGVALNHFY